MKRVVTHALRRADAPESAHLAETVQETLYCEEQRLEHTEASPRTKSDREFVASLRHDFARADEAGQRELVYRVVVRYVEEIAGRFDANVYSLATHVLPLALGGLMGGVRHGATPLRSAWMDSDLDDRIRIGGDIDSLRKLAQIGTIVLAPSHVSNLDSVILGWAIHRLGLPPFAYGAGLNLFSNALVGFFMRNLGAYTVDRTKSDPLYRETLKEYATVLLEHGQHSLFFPGGTRSRSGAIEQTLKMGLLGTVPVALRHGLEVGAQRRPFVVPCTLTYPLVLEAASLVDEFLRAEGRARYVDARDEFDRPSRWFDFVRGLLDLDLVIHVHFGKPMDAVGNDVDAEGESLDPRGRRIDPRGYLSVAGSLSNDPLRDAEYTRMMAARLMASYRTDTVAVPTSVLAYAVFECLRRERAQPDLFRLLGSIRSEVAVPLDTVTATVARACDELRELEARGQIRVAEDLRSAPTVVRRALETFGTYHPRPVVALRGDRLVVGGANLLFYYRNRLDGSGLLGAPELLRDMRHGTGHLEGGR